MKIPVKFISLAEQLFMMGKQYGTKITAENINNADLQMFYDSGEKGVFVIKNHEESAFIPNGAYNSITFAVGKDLIKINEEYDESFKFKAPAAVPIQAYVPQPQVQAQVWQPGGPHHIDQPAPITPVKRKPGPKKELEGEA